MNPVRNSKNNKINPIRKVKIFNGVKFNLPEEEEKVLEFWEQSNIFKKSLEKNENKKAFVFYEGPPTANGRPGIHHVLARVFKDIICRFKTMQGFYVARQAGWDTHGLPVELQVEKELGIKTKKDIEEYGIGKFNQKCKESVWQYKEEWENLTKRIGFWLDLENPYITYENGYMETLFGIIKKFHEKGLLFEDKKVVPWCPRCQTSLSSHELSQGYKKVKEKSIYVKFKISPDQKIGGKEISKNTYFLAWTTTPWTLPGNVALAVNLNLTYVLANKENENYILVKDRLKNIFEDEEFKIREEFSGEDLLGLEYEPLYPPKNQEALENAWQSVAGNFVSTQEGTGIVHIAPAFGEDDYNLFKCQMPNVKCQIPVTVNENGAMKKGVIGEGKFVKDADFEIIKDLESRGLLFADEMYEHDYPFCWRCKTSLLYYLHPSWFVRVSEVKKELIKNNQEINWVPKYLKDGRFGKFLEEARDWNFSRERYWGTPLPVWKCENNGCGNLEIIGSKEDILKQKFSNNNYFMMRHGESVNNVGNIVSCFPEKENYPLTDKGKKQVLETIRELKEKKIDLIFSSKILRTKETAEIIGAKLGIAPEFDNRLIEVGVGIFNGELVKKAREFWNKEGNISPLGQVKQRYFLAPPEGGETYDKIEKRIYNFIEELEEKYEGKNILIVSHERVISLLEKKIKDGSVEELVENIVSKKVVKNAEIRKIEYKKLPYNKDLELDFHRPYIDEIEFQCPKCGAKMKRVKEVVDCWFDSGAMPFASKAAFPADYICEAIDQTRGWFYTLLVISTLLDKKSPYKNVVSLGHILDGKGQKMSKSLGNIVDPWEVVKKYGVDCLRWHLFTINQPGDTKKFDEIEIRKSYNRFLSTFWNSFKFYNDYKKNSNFKIQTLKSSNILDKWILSRLQDLISSVAKHLEKFEIVVSAREIEEFTLNDFSNWYIRRSRSRFQKPKNKKELEEALGTLGFALVELSKLCAPFTPFLSEMIFREMKSEKESVHLEDFPEVDSSLIDKELEDKMEKVREVIVLGLSKRKEAQIKVRQPLAKLTILSNKFEIQNELVDLIKEELNVKEVEIEDRKGELEIKLDTEITKELRDEGSLREILRIIKDLKKKNNLKRENKIKIFIESPEIIKNLIEKNKEGIKKESVATQIEFQKEEGCLAEKIIKIGDDEAWIGIKEV